MATSNSTPVAQIAEYSVWQDMKQRCYNPKCCNYPHYGARGIRVCDRWRHDFTAFLADMGRRPSFQHSIDRIDNEGNYSCGHCEECLRNGWPANCRWATWTEQNRNRRTNHEVTFQGRTMCLAAWAKELGIAAPTLFGRINRRGWTVERALSTPPQTGSQLSQDVVARIKAACAGGQTQRSVATEYSVSQCYISMIVNGYRRC